jgi:asparagine N-glycosylation enzyme membrane subunit Stt3
MVAVGAAAAEAYYMAIWPPLPLFYLLLVVFIILLCILSVLMKTDFVQHCMNLILINQISKINK